MGPLKIAHDHCKKHKDELQRSNVIGCFYCKSFVKFEDIKEWVGDDDGVCPKCGIDSLIGDASGFSIDEAFLDVMHKRWFEGGTRNKRIVRLTTVVIFNNKKPTSDELKETVNNYFRGLATFNRLTKFDSLSIVNCWTLNLPTTGIIRIYLENLNNTKGFGPNIYIQTKTEDKLTHDLAKGLAEEIALVYEAQLD